MAETTKEEIGIFLKEFNQAKTVDAPDRMRGIRNMLAYLSLDGGQWPIDLKQGLTAEGREAKQYNFLQYLIRGHAGNVLMNWVDPVFVLRDEGPQDAVDALSKIWYANKEHYNYKAESICCFEDGYVYRGVQELRICRPSPNPREWGIAFPHIRSDMVIFDPNNLTDRISRNSKKAWKMNLMTPAQMIRTWDNKTDEIISAVKRDEKDGERYANIPADYFANLDYQDTGSAMLVVEKLWIKQERVKYRYLRTPTGEPDLRWELPETGYKPGSPEDVALLQEWALRNGFILTDDMVVEFTGWRDINWITTVCPALGVVLEDRKDERQLNGHLPLYAWSFIQKRGKSVGLVDILWDVQQDFNRREMMKTKILTQSPIGGKPWVSEDAVPETGNMTLEDVVSSMNDSSKPFIVPSTMRASDAMGIVPGTNVPAALLHDIGFKLELADKLASLPLAMQGISARSGESGVHFGRKVIEGSVMQRMPQEWIMQHENDKAEDWVIMAIKLYGHRANINREFKFDKGRQSVIINKFEGYDENGNEIWRNDISKLKRVEVIIGQTSENQFMRQARAESAVSSLQAIPPTPTNDVVRAAFECELALNQDFKSQESKERVEKMVELRFKLAELSAQIQIQAAQNQLRQLSQLAAVQAQQQPPIPQQPMPIEQAGTFTAQAPPQPQTQEQFPGGRIPLEREVSRPV